MLSYNLEFKKAVIKDIVKQGLNKRGVQTAVARKYNVSDYSVSIWKKELLATVLSELHQVKKHEYKLEELLSENKELKKIIIEKELVIYKLKQKINH